MASFSVIGFVDTIKLLQDSCLLYVSEFKKGYKKSNGEIVDDKYLSWKIIFKGYFKKYLTQHFNKGMLVEVKGDILPYAIEHDKSVDGYSIIGQVCNLYSYPRLAVKSEIKMIKDSQAFVEDVPDLKSFNEPDF